MDLLTKKDLAKKLRISISSLNRLRNKYKDFPKGMSFGEAWAGSKIFFDNDEVDSWLIANKELFKNNAC